MNKNQKISYIDYTKITNSNVEYYLTEIIIAVYIISCTIQGIITEAFTTTNIVHILLWPIGLSLMTALLTFPVLIISHSNLVVFNQNISKILVIEKALIFNSYRLTKTMDIRPNMNARIYKTYIPTRRGRSEAYLVRIEDSNTPAFDTNNCFGDQYCLPTGYKHTDKINEVLSGNLRYYEIKDSKILFKIMSIISIIIITFLLWGMSHAEIFLSIVFKLLR